MFLPDMRTVFVLSMLVNLVLAVLMLVYWRTQKTYAGFGYMTLSNGLVAIAFLMFAIRGMIPEYLSVLGANLAIGLAAIGRLEGIRRFLGIIQLQKHYFLLILIQIVLASYLTLVQNSEFLRAICITALISFFIARLIYMIWVDRSQADKSLLWVIAVFHSCYLFILVARALYWTSSMDGLNLFTPSLANYGYFIYDLLYHIGLTVLYIMLNSQRLAAGLLVVQKKLEVLATTDALTDLVNNRTLREMGQTELLRSQRMSHTMTLLMFDIDHFKNVNDTYGHAAGDRILQMVGQQARKICRRIDTVGRMGGDEFVLLMPETAADQAGIVAERLRQTVAQEVFPWEAKQIRITLSIGLAELSPADKEFESLLKRADDALYAAKRSGRDRIVVL